MTPEQIRELLKAMGPAQNGESPAQQCARYILQIAESRGGKLSSAQRHQLMAMGYLNA